MEFDSNAGGSESNTLSCRGVTRKLPLFFAYKVNLHVTRLFTIMAKSQFVKGLYETKTKILGVF